MIGDLVHSLNHKQPNGNLSSALSASISGSNLWCAERLTSVRKLWQDIEGPFSPVWSLRVALLQAVSTVWQLRGRRRAKSLRTLMRRCASIMPSKNCVPLEKPVSSHRPSSSMSFSQRCLSSANSSSLRLCFFFFSPPEVSQGPSEKKAGFLCRSA